MNMKGNEVNNSMQELSNLRSMVLLDAEQNSDKYHVLDIQRVKEDNRFLSRFLLARKGNVEDAFKMAKNVLEWRKNFDVYGITKDSIPSKYFAACAILPFNKDKKGNVVLLLRVKQYQKLPGEEECVKKFIIYWLDKMDREHHSEQITVVFNCKDCGIANLDLDLVRFMITAFTNHYPRFLSHILVFEMPWIYSAAWRVVKSWLPDNAVDKIKLVNRESVLEYIDKSQLHLEMGGLETEPSVVCNEPQDISKGKQITVPNNCAEEIVRVSPSEELKFPKDGGDNTVTFTISNVSKSAVIYKIKTTNRERYRAWPHFGLIKPSDSVKINAQLISIATCHDNDKFLIMATKIANNKLPNESYFSTQSDVVEFKLRCVMSVPSESKQRTISSSVESLNLEDLQRRLQRIEENMMSLQRKQVFWFSLCCMLILLHTLLDCW